MTLAGLMLGTGALTLLILGLALGLELYCFAAAIVLVALLYCAVSVLLARRRLSVSLTVDKEEILRGDSVSYSLLAVHKPFLPVGPLRVICNCADRAEARHGRYHHAGRYPRLAAGRPHEARALEADGPAAGTAGAPL